MASYFPLPPSLVNYCVDDFEVDCDRTMIYLTSYYEDKAILHRFSLSQQCFLPEVNRLNGGFFFGKPTIKGKKLQENSNSIIIPSSCWYDYLYRDKGILKTIPDFSVVFWGRSPYRYIRSNDTVIYWNLLTNDSIIINDSGEDYDNIPFFFRGRLIVRSENENSLCYYDEQGPINFPFLQESHIRIFSGPNYICYISELTRSLVLLS